MFVATDTFRAFSSRPPRAEPVARSSSVAEQVRLRLENSPYPQHRRLRISFREGVLTLRGSVSCYYLRQTAQALVAELGGVEELIDLIEVVES
jgi:hypothetical protein